VICQPSLKARVLILNIPGWVREKSSSISGKIVKLIMGS